MHDDPAHPARSRLDALALLDAYLRRPYLTLKEKGVLAMIATGVADTTARILELSSDGRDATTAALRGLAAAGVIRAVELRDEEGRVRGKRYEVLP